jgi:type VI secretion system protein ImpA
MKKITRQDIDKIIAPIAGGSPSGEDLRYSGVYEEIKEARRADDTLNQGDWQRDLKVSDWEKVIKAGLDSLANKTKDIQIAVWLTEALIKKAGFAGLADGLNILAVYLSDFWDSVYPAIDDGDLEFRAGPLSFLNDKVSPTINEIPLTDQASTEGYSYSRWQESRQTGFEKDLKNQYGDIDENKKKARDEKMSEGKITGEQFDAAASRSSKQFYASLAEEISRCKAGFERFDAVVEEKFGREAPRLTELGKAIDDNLQLVERILKEKGGLEPAQKKEAKQEVAEPAEAQEKRSGKKLKQAPAETVPVQPAGGVSVIIQPASLGESSGVEEAVWQDALDTLDSGGIKEALQKLLDASSSAPSVRQKNRYKLLMAKLSLKAQRADLAKPVIEQLYALIDELGLEKWESPVWIAEVIDSYYQCLTSEGAHEDDFARARNELFPKLCTRDITKAIAYKEQINSGG